LGTRDLVTVESRDLETCTHGPRDLGTEVPRDPQTRDLETGTQGPRDVGTERPRNSQTRDQGHRDQ
jgi:hypothetical protein